ncbi:MAG: SDR family oxidoreductase [Actinomycetota bacterium]|nr:SDR family oxidoreductase [Actinomycetota bacterium]
MSKHALITGGAGFLGSHLCEFWLERGWTVECVDNFVTGDPRNVAHLDERAGFSLVQHDVIVPYRPEGEPDLVLHFASPASPPAYLALPIETLEVGSLGTMNALDIARAFGAVFVLASTSEVYGDPEVHPQPESYRGNVSTTGPRSVYDEAKRFAEAVTVAYHRKHGVDVRIGRIFNTYGPRLSPGDGRAIPNFVAQALEGAPITVYGDGSQTRSFCYVDDLIEGFAKLAESTERDPVNIGNPGEYTILSLAEKIIEKTGSRSEIVFEPLPVDDPKVRRPDITRARAILGWEPKVSLDEGLDRTIEWFRSVA